MELVISDSAEELIRQLCIDMPKLDIVPVRGWIICLDIPHEQVTKGGIITTETPHNYTVGAVVKVYEPYEKQLKYTREDGGYMEKWQLVSCEFKAGDLVLYPSYAGRNLANDKKLRFVEVGGGLNDSGCVLGKLENNDDETLVEVINDIGMGTGMSYAEASVVARRLTNKYVIVSKEPRLL